MPWCEVNIAACPTASPVPLNPAGKFQKQGVRSLVFSPAADMFAVGLTDDSVEILDQHTLAPVRIPPKELVQEQARMHAGDSHPHVPYAETE